MADAPISEELTALKRRARRRLVGAVALVLAALVVLWTVMDDKPPQSLTGQPVTIVSSDPSLVSTVSPAQPAVKPSITPNAPAVPAPAVIPPVASTTVTPVPATTVPAPQAKPATAVVPVAPAAMPAPIKPDASKPDTVANSTPSPAHTDGKPATPPKKQPDAPAAKDAKDARKDKLHNDPAKILAGMDEMGASTHARPSAPVDDAAKFYLQLGAFADHDKANNLVSKASAAGVSVKHESVKTDKGELYRLRAGPYGSKAEATRAHDRLASAGITSSVVGK